MRNLAPAYPCNEHFKIDLTAAAVKVLSFLDSNGDPIRAERIYLRYFQVGGTNNDRVHWKGNPVAASGVDADANDFWMYPDETNLMIPSLIQDLRFFTPDAGTYTVHVIAQGYEDLSNSTIA